MAKNMARLQDGIVVNIEWLSDEQSENENLKSYNNLPIQIGDVYKDGTFYRDGEEVLSVYDMLQKKIAELEAQNASLMQESEDKEQLLTTYRTALAKE